MWVFCLISVKWISQVLCLWWLLLLLFSRLFGFLLCFLPFLFCFSFFLLFSEFLGPLLTLLTLDFFGHVFAEIFFGDHVRLPPLAREVSQIYDLLVTLVLEKLSVVILIDREKHQRRQLQHLVGDADVAMPRHTAVKSRHVGLV